MPRYAEALEPEVAVLGDTVTVLPAWIMPAWIFWAAATMIPSGQETRRCTATVRLAAGQLALPGSARSGQSRSSGPLSARTLAVMSSQLRVPAAGRPVTVIWWRGAVRGASAAGWAWPGICMMLFAWPD